MGNEEKGTKKYRVRVVSAELGGPQGATRSVILKGKEHPPGTTEVNHVLIFPEWAFPLAIEAITHDLLLEIRTAKEIVSGLQPTHVALLASWHQPH